LNRPIFTSRKEYGRYFTDATYWQPYIKTICARHDLGPGGEVRAGLPGTNPVFIVAESYAIKLYSDLFAGDISYPVERAVYELIARQPLLPAPALIATGELFDPAGGWPWPYLVTQAIPGLSVGESPVGEAELLALAGWLGPPVRRLHRLPLDGAEPLRPTWDSFMAFLTHQRAIITPNQAGWGLPAHFVAQLETYLPELAE
jgi:hypothetical protein